MKSMSERIMYSFLPVHLYALIWDSVEFHFHRKLARFMRLDDFFSFSPALDNSPFASAVIASSWPQRLIQKCSKHLHDDTHNKHRCCSSNTLLTIHYHLHPLSLARMVLCWLSLIDRAWISWCHADPDCIAVSSRAPGDNVEAIPLSTTSSRLILPSISWCSLLVPTYSICNLLC